MLLAGRVAPVPMVATRRFASTIMAIKAAVRRGRPSGTPMSNLFPSSQTIRRNLSCADGMSLRRVALSVREGVKRAG
jgi:hypothetical protein